MGGEGLCTGDLVGTERSQFILSFGEDEDGELYVLTTSNASPTAKTGTVYQLIDPSRYVPNIQYSTLYFSSMQTSKAYRMQTKYQETELPRLKSQLTVIYFTNHFIA